MKTVSKFEYQYYHNDITNLASQSKSYQEISDKLKAKYPNRNKKAINFERHTLAEYMKKNRIRKLEQTYDWLYNQDFFEYDIKSFMKSVRGQIFIGSLLGDGWIHKQWNYFSIKHAMSQKKLLLSIPKKYIVVKKIFEESISTGGDVK